MTQYPQSPRIVAHLIDILPATLLYINQFRNRYTLTEMYLNFGAVRTVGRCKVCFKQVSQVYKRETQFRLGTCPKDSPFLRKGDVLTDQADEGT